MDAKRAASDAMEIPAAKTMRSTISQKFEDKVNTAKKLKNSDSKPTEFISSTEKLDWVSTARKTPKPHQLVPYANAPLLTLRYRTTSNKQMKHNSITPSQLKIYFIGFDYTQKEKENEKVKEIFLKNPTV